MQRYLERAGMHCCVETEMDALLSAVDQGAGAVLLTEEALSPEGIHKLATVLAQQPPWSEIPVIILTGLPSIDGRRRSFYELEQRTNVTLVDRPVRVASLVSAARSALRSRQRQYEIRDLMIKL